MTTSCSHIEMAAQSQKRKKLHQQQDELINNITELENKILTEAAEKSRNVRQQPGPSVAKKPRAQVKPQPANTDKAGRTGKYQGTASKAEDSEDEATMAVKSGQGKSGNGKQVNMTAREVVGYTWKGLKSTDKDMSVSLSDGGQKDINMNDGARVSQSQPVFSVKDYAGLQDKLDDDPATAIHSSSMPLTVKRLGTPKIPITKLKKWTAHMAVPNLDVHNGGGEVDNSGGEMCDNGDEARDNRDKVHDNGDDEGRDGGVQQQGEEKWGVGDGRRNDGELEDEVEDARDRQSVRSRGHSKDQDQELEDEPADDRWQR
ncbi:hypothetical protein PAXINDRAFT_157315 [Paxillus involutus ATCC 200175]|uniref:Uncharacterized protein n=1 Tax=Paxillus involutus ATCC 200175 TaxID=664439 RepID=A0A0C9SSM9_PAXIN|nr:hypothetical protein PAXINDRAFT_157315 [Paxillus involutus ATCC 200175]